MLLRNWACHASLCVWHLEDRCRWQPEALRRLPVSARWSVTQRANGLKVPFILRPLKLYWRLQLLTFFAVIRSCKPRPSVRTRRFFWGAFVSRIIFSVSFNLTPIWGYFRAMSGLLYSITISELLKGLSELHMCNTLILLHICSKSKRKSLIRLNVKNWEQLFYNQWVRSSSLSGAPLVSKA